MNNTSLAADIAAVLQAIDNLGVSFACDCGAADCSMKAVNAAVRHMCSAHGLTLPFCFLAPDELAAAAVESPEPAYIWTIEDVPSSQLLDYIMPITQMLSASSRLPATEQINAAYSYGGGWQPIPGFAYNADNGNLAYPGDPLLRRIAFAQSPRGETISIYEHAIVCVEEPDGSFSVSRID